MDKRGETIIMSMKIYTANNVIPASKQVNRIGKYLYRNLDGAYKFESGSNQFDVYFVVVYENEDGEQEEMNLDLNIATYQNKLRVNIIEMTENQKTIGFDVFKPEKLEDLSQAYKQILTKVYKRLEKAYPDFLFVIPESLK